MVIYFYLDVLEIDAEIGACKNISFHPNCQEHIMLAFEKQIIFLYWVILVLVS